MVTGDCRLVEDVETNLVDGGLTTQGVGEAAEAIIKGATEMLEAEETRATMATLHRPK